MLRQYHEMMIRAKFQFAYIAKLIALGLMMQIIIFIGVSIFLNIDMPKQALYEINHWLHINYKNFVYGLIHKPSIQYNKEIVANAFLSILTVFKYPILFSFSGWLMPISLNQYLKKRAANHIKEYQVAGSKIISINEFVKKLKKFPSDLKIGGLQKDFILLDEDKKALRENRKEEKEFRKSIVPIPKDSELRHFLIVGRSGAGKTILLNPTIEQLKLRQEKMLIHDFKGDMLTKFYNPIRDLVFNPLDKRCVQWNIWNDIENEIDIKSIASSLFQSNRKEDPFWNNAARDVFEAIMIYLHKNSLRTNKYIYEYLSKPAEEILTILKSDPDTQIAANYISDPNSKQTQGVISKLIQNTKFFQYLKNIDGIFSIKNWIEKEKDSTIFITNYADIKDTIAPALTLFIDIAARVTLTLNDDLNRRIFFIMDEFGQLNKMNSLVDILTNGRSKGVSFWLAIQDISQIDEKYGINLRKTIVNSFSNYVVFALNDHETAKFFVDKIGERKIISEDEMMQHDSKAKNDNLGARRSKKVENLILSSDFLNMKDREVFVKLSNIKEMSKMKVYFKKFEDITERIIIR